MADFFVLGTPEAGPVPAVVALKGSGRTAVPNFAGHVLVNADDAQPLRSNRWRMVASGDDDFIKTMLSCTDGSGKPLWRAGPNGTYNSEQTV